MSSEIQDDFSDLEDFPHELPDLTEKDLNDIEKSPIIHHKTIYEDSSVDFAFDQYVNIMLDTYSTAYMRNKPPGAIPDHRVMMLSFSQIEKYMNTVEHPGFTRVPRTNTQFSWYKKYINQKKKPVVTFDPPKLEHFIPGQFGIALGIGKEINKSLRKVVKKITKKKHSRKH